MREEMGVMKYKPDGGRLRPDGWHQSRLGVEGGVGDALPHPPDPSTVLVIVVLVEVYVERRMVGYEFQSTSRDNPVD